MSDESIATRGGHPSVSALTIAVLTFRRPRDLGEILPALAAQASSIDPDVYRCRIVVVDNDPEGGARAAVTAFDASSEETVAYENETEPGISHARNRALDVSEDQDLLVFIDDDERPSEDWLVLLLETLADANADAVVGPVISTYEVEPDPWIVAGGFFVRRRLPTGTRLEVAATNNLLLDLATVRRLGLRFDPAFGISGGDDTMFTKQLRARGGTMVWCDEAIVFDVVPRTRTTRRWVVRRAFSSGNSASLTTLALAGHGPRLPLRVRLTIPGLVRAAGGLARIVVGSVTRSRRHRARGVRTAARGAGMVAGAWGYSYLEYRRG